MGGMGGGVPALTLYKTFPPPSSASLALPSSQKPPQIYALCRSDRQALPLALGGGTHGSEPGCPKGTRGGGSSFPPPTSTKEGIIALKQRWERRQRAPRTGSSPPKASRGWGHPVHEPGGGSRTRPPLAAAGWILHPQGDTQQLTPEQDKVTGGGCSSPPARKLSAGGSHRDRTRSDGGAGGMETQGRGSEAPAPPRQQAERGSRRGTGGEQEAFEVSSQFPNAAAAGGGQPQQQPPPHPKAGREVPEGHEDGVKAPRALLPLALLRARGPVSEALPAPNVGGHGQGPGRSPPQAPRGRPQGAKGRGETPGASCSGCAPVAFGRGTAPTAAARPYARRGGG